MSAPFAACRLSSRIFSTRCHILRHAVRHASYMASNRNILLLHERGIFQNVFPEERTPDLLRALNGSPQCVYCGFDPTADSLHVGNLLALMALMHCQRAGHQAIVVLGGASAQIGDPSGKTKERPAVSVETIYANIESIRRSIRDIFHNHQEHFYKDSRPLLPVKILDNSEWYAKRNIVEFLASVGRHFRMGDLLRKQSVQSRLSSPEGMSLTEFTYQVFQAYDWLHLYRQNNCLVQIGGNDQMGNIKAGHDLISRITNKNVFGLTVPLITTTTGDKLGKTAGNAVWLKPEKTSPFELYQYFMQRPDSEVEVGLKLFTFLTTQDIDQIMKEHRSEPDLWRAQRRLAKEVTTLIHGKAGLQSARRCTQVLFHNSTDALVQMTEKELAELFRNATTVELFLEPGMELLDTVMKAKCFNREVDALRVIRQGGVYVNQQREDNPAAVMLPGQHILANNITLLRTGKRNYYIIKWMG